MLLSVVAVRARRQAMKAWSHDDVMTRDAFPLFRISSTGASLFMIKTIPLALEEVKFLQKQRERKSGIPAIPSLRTTGVDLAKELLDTFTARQMGKVFFTNSGSEANDS
ncbi:hypothetical protein Syun_012829 [Stephania yunnanensis]|uniref:Uncharacterized protein n=1 Tax=Stephania yunnanensis TaxID=152371 RepID=A0AAP0K0Z2_9MAGN